MVVLLREEGPPSWIQLLRLKSAHFFDLNYPAFCDDRARTAQVRHSMKTEVGLQAARKCMTEINELFGEEESSFAGIEDLVSRGLVREILYRSTEEIFSQTWLIPHIFDVYLEYKVGKKTKTYLLRLHFELGD